MLDAAMKFQTEALKLRQQHVADGIAILQMLPLDSALGIAAHELLSEAIAVEVEAIELASVRLGIDRNSWRPLLGDGPTANG